VATAAPAVPRKGVASALPVARIPTWKPACTCRGAFFILGTFDQTRRDRSQISVKVKIVGRAQDPKYFVRRTGGT
jgi:hypothetical protein